MSLTVALETLTINCSYTPFHTPFHTSYHHQRIPYQVSNMFLTVALETPTTKCSYAPFHTPFIHLITINASLTRC